MRVDDGGRPGFNVPHGPHGLCRRKTTLNLKKKKKKKTLVRVQELCERRGKRPGLNVPNSPHGLCGHKATPKKKNTVKELRSCVKVEVDVLRSPSLTLIVH